MRRPNRQSIDRAVRTALPLLLVALLSVGLTLWLRQPPPTATTIQIILPPAPPGTPRVPPTETLPPPEPTPPLATPTIVAFPSDTVSLEIVTLRQDLRRAVASFHLQQAAARLQTARLALRDNDIPEVLRQLTVAQTDLDAAAPLAADDVKANIQLLVNDLNYLRDDVPVRPESIDDRLAELWEKAATLAGVGLPQ